VRTIPFRESSRLSELRPWHYPPKREMQFGEWLRNDIEAGRFESAMVDPDLAILMSKLRLHSTPLHGPEAVCLFEAVPAADFVTALTDTFAQWKAQSDWNGDEKNVLLALTLRQARGRLGSIVVRHIQRNVPFTNFLPRAHRRPYCSSRTGRNSKPASCRMQAYRRHCQFVLRASSVAWLK